jgi:hypothetical protein
LEYTGYGNVAPAPEMSVACATTASDSVAAVASMRLTLKKFMDQVLLIYGILWASIAHCRGALHDRNVTLS